MYELKEKVAKQTVKPGGSTDWPAETQELSLNGEVLADEMTLVECNVKDRDRLLLARAQPDAGPGGLPSEALESALHAISECAAQLDTFEAQMASRQAVHQELFTRLLERLDGLTLDGLSDEERTLVRAQRKELVQRTQIVSAQA